MKTVTTRWMAAAAVAAAMAVGANWQAAQAATVTYVGAEISTSSSGAWAVNKNAFRSTDDGIKAYALPDHPNAYGEQGYIMFGTSDASVTQEASGDFTGTIYTGTRSGQSFNNPAPGVASVALLGGAGRSAGTWEVESAYSGGNLLDDASQGIGTAVANVANGTLWYRWNDNETQHNLIEITLNGDSYVPVIRIGVMTDRGDSQKPGAIGLNGVWQSALGTLGYGQPDWYFFDITNAAAGDTVTISITRWYDGQWGTDLRGLVFDTTIPEPASVALLGLAGLALLRRRR